jgi:peroxiredoxin
VTIIRVAGTFTGRRSWIWQLSSIISKVRGSFRCPERIIDSSAKISDIYSQMNIINVFVGIMFFVFGLVSATPAEALTGIENDMIPPPFTLPDDNGEEVSLSSFQGSPLAIIFWSTWSPRSKEILEDFREHHSKYSSEGLKIIAINIDGEKLNNLQHNEIREYASSMALPFPILYDDELLTFASYGVMAHPSFVLIDSGGKVAYSLGGYPLSLREELRENIDKILIAPERTDEEDIPRM